MTHRSRSREEREELPAEIAHFPASGLVQEVNIGEENYD
jgi:hypothetical protein